VNLTVPWATRWAGTSPVNALVIDPMRLIASPPVANRPDHDSGDLSVNEEYLAGEFDYLVEQSVGSGARRCKRRANAEGDQEC
jgi:hypothetical protein